ncbi:hypothetical protein J7413_08900 [Shimia sp. R10_1]|uniref:hypothetical protein n=1 Tax=Shimia sp. R10_1 TaxID=2821095 RepID=UPI001ADCEBE5|nr:hypothetical protein [Shimia sp. R10_1]MBO9473653.1 hypothetical protein [Shimia sp. R10_1]
MFKITKRRALAFFMLGLGFLIVGGLLVTKNEPYSKPEVIGNWFLFIGAFFAVFRGILPFVVTRLLKSLEGPTGWYGSQSNSLGMLAFRELMVIQEED